MVLEVQVDAKRARLRFAGMNTVRAVVEQGDGVVAVHARIVLPLESGPRAHLEAGVLAAERPQNLPGSLADLVHAPGVADRYEQIAVRELLDRVHVCEIPRGA